MSHQAGTEHRKVVDTRRNDQHPPLDTTIAETPGHLNPCDETKAKREYTRKDEYKSKPKQEYARREEYQSKKEYRPKKEYKPTAEYARGSFASESPAKPSFVFLDNVDGDYDIIQVSGDTFTIKDQLKQKFHARWDKAKRAWNVSRQDKHRVISFVLDEGKLYRDRTR